MLIIKSIILAISYVQTGRQIYCFLSLRERRMRAKLLRDKFFGIFQNIFCAFVFFHEICRIAFCISFILIINLEN